MKFETARNQFPSSSPPPPAAEVGHSSCRLGIHTQYPDTQTKKMTTSLGRCLCLCPPGVDLMLNSNLPSVFFFFLLFTFSIVHLVQPNIASQA